LLLVTVVQLVCVSFKWGLLRLLSWMVPDVMMDAPADHLLTSMRLHYGTHYSVRNR
jgi:hypothetical protein